MKPGTYADGIEAAARVADAEAKRSREKAVRPENDRPFQGTIEEVYGSEALTAEDIAKAIAPSPRWIGCLRPLQGVRAGGGWSRSSRR
jgi:hypothetical protein